MKLKRSIAFLAAVSMIAGSTGTVFAAGAYSEAEKKAASAALEDFSVVYQKDLDRAEGLLEGGTAVNADLKLELGETVRALAGMAASMDISWFSDLGMKYDVAMNGTMQAVTGSLYVNDTDVCTFEIYMDYETLTNYVYVPEILPYYLKLSMAEAYDEETAAVLSMTKQLLEDPLALYPDAQTIKDILDRYLSMLFDGFESGDGESETLNLNGTDIPATLYEGAMYEKNAYDMLKGILTTARDDAQIKEIIDSWTSVIVPEASGEVYSSLQSEIDTMLADMNEESGVSTDQTAYVSSAVWTDTDGNVIGRRIGFMDSGEEYPLFSYRNLQDGTNSELMISVNADDTIVSLEGSGALAEGKLEGTYDVLVDGRKAAEIGVSNYDIASMEAGCLNASYTVQLEQGFVEDEDYNMLTSFALSLDCAVDPETEDTELVLGLSTSGMDLGTLTMTAGYGEMAELPELSSLEDVIDLASEADAEKLAASLDWTPVKDNCIAAGIPAELVEMADEAIRAELFGAEEEEAELIY